MNERSAWAMVITVMWVAITAVCITALIVGAPVEILAGAGIIGGVVTFWTALVVF